MTPADSPHPDPPRRPPPLAAKPVPRGSPPSFHERHVAWLLERARRAVRIRLLVIVGCAVLAIAAVVAVYLVVRARRLEGCRELAEHYGRAAGLDPALVLAVVRAESAGDPRAVSRAGARGLMQLMPATAAEVAKKAGIALESYDKLFDPELNVRLGTLYLAELRRFFKDDPYLYIAAYNAGPGNVDKWCLQNPTLSSREIIEHVAFAETRTYVRRVLRFWGEQADPSPLSRGRGAGRGGR